MFDVFISYSSKNVVVANSVCDYLESNGMKCWIAPRNVTGGKLYGEEIVDGINESQVFLLLYSEYSNLSKHVLSELDTAFNAGKVIVPFKLDDSKMSNAMSYYLTATHMILASSLDEANYEDLKSTIENNIPELAKEKNKSLMLEQIAASYGLSVDALKSSLSRASRANGEKQDVQGGSRYDILQNDKGEILILLSPSKGEPDYPLFLIDSISRYALLYRNHDSTVVFKSISREINVALRKNSSILIIEAIEDDIQREYSVPVEIVKDVRALLDDQSEFNDAEDLYVNIGDLDKEGGLKEEHIKNENVFLDIDPSTIAVDAISELVYQDSGDCILAFTDSTFMVLDVLTSVDVAMLDATHQAYIEMPHSNPDLDEEDIEVNEQFPLFFSWMKGQDLMDTAISIKATKVKSVLQYVHDLI